MRKLAFALVFLGLPCIGLAASSEEEKRKSILEQLGLEKTEAAPPKQEDIEQEEAPAPQEPATESAERAPKAQKPTARLVYVPKVHALMVEKCLRCHKEGGKAKKSDFLVTGVQETFAAAARYVKGTDLSNSSLYTQAIGRKHKGGKTLKLGSPEEKLLAQWIRDGANLGSTRAVEATQKSIAAATPATAKSPSAEPAPSESETPPETLTSDAVAEALQAPDPSFEVAAIFDTQVYPALVRGCAECHEGSAGDEGFVVTDDARTTLPYATRQVVPGDPAASALLALPQGGEEHERVWSPGDPDSLVVMAWVERQGSPPLDSVPAPKTESSTALKNARSKPSAPTAPSGLGDGTLTGRYKNYGIDLPLGFRLNGRFDLNYERRDFEGNAFSEDATAALRSYHTFLFVGRDPGTDGVPFGISIEAITLQFWEAYFLYEPEALDVRLLLKMGRILVPFGADPLFHNSYGGLAAFDSRLLPVFWAQEGIAANVQWRRGLISVSDDIYAVRGYSLRDPEGRVDLQGGFSSRDDVELGGGNRLGVSVGPITAWYSLYYNGLDAGRRLVMQAFDVSVFRPRLSVLEYLSAGAGLLRADVSGAGPGIDYYDVGTYWEFHVYPIRGLDIRYRQGLRTFDNRGDFFFDERRESALDGSTHTLGATYRFRGLEVAAHRFWNFEKVDEIPDDFLRFTVAYAF
ncbi:MAG: hypothetical protein AAF658_00210 [Myxococcota bacterium]